MTASTQSINTLTALCTNCNKSPNTSFLRALATANAAVAGASVPCRTAWTKSVKTSANFAFCGMSRSRRRDGKWRHFARLHIKELLERNLSVSSLLSLPLLGDEIEFPKHVFLLLLFPCVEIPGGVYMRMWVINGMGIEVYLEKHVFQKGVFQYIRGVYEDIGCLCEDIWGVWGLTGCMWGHMGCMRTYGVHVMWGHMGCMRT